jgi:hypothetical protein
MSFNKKSFERMKLSRSGWVLAGPVLRDFFFARFHFNANWKSIQLFKFNAIIIGVTKFWHRRHALNFGLTRFGTNVPWPQLSCVGGQQKWRHCNAISHVCGLITLRHHHAADVFPPHQHWVWLPKWVRNMYLQHLVQSKLKIGERQSVLTRNYT